MKQGVQSSLGLVCHQHLDLSLGKVLDVEVDRPCLKLLGLDYPPRRFILLIPEQPPALERHAPPRDSLQG